jgi:hypothetical protein
MHGTAWISLCGITRGEFHCQSLYDGIDSPLDFFIQCNNLTALSRNEGSNLNLGTHISIDSGDPLYIHSRQYAYAGLFIVVMLLLSRYRGHAYALHRYDSLRHAFSH